MTDNRSEPSTIGTIASLILKGLADYDCDPVPLFAQAGIDIGEIHDPYSRFPIVNLQRLWHLAVEETGDPCFGLVVAGQFQPSALRGLGLAWLASDSLHDAFGRLIRFSRFINTAIEVRLVEDDEAVDLVITGPENFPDFAYASMDTGMAAMLRMCRITCGDALLPRRVVMQRPPPPDKAPYEAMFGTTIEYGGATNVLSFDAAVVNAPLAAPNPELARLNDQTVIDYLARFDRDSVAMQVRAKIIEHLPGGTPLQESVAKSLNRSLRSLQRRLSDENTSFRQLLEETRRELALHYIRESHRPIGEITYLLGFAEHSNFTRAFRRWTGHSPVSFRERRPTPGTHA